MNRSIVYSLLTIAFTLTLVTTATWAFFNDAGSSSDNIFSAGTLQLKLTDANESAQDAVSASFGGSLSPGNCTGDAALSFRNTGTLAADHAEVAVQSTVTDASNNSNPDMDAFLRIKKLTYDGTDVSTQISDANGNSYKDLADWGASSTALDGLFLKNLNADHALVMDICLDGSADNSIQGDSVSSVFTVTLNQHASQ